MLSFAIQVWPLHARAVCRFHILLLTSHALVAQAEGASIPISGVTFLHALKVETSNVLRNVAILDALWLGFFLLGIGLLYATLPRPLVVHKHKLGARARRSASTNSISAPPASDSSDDF